ncbi:DUF4386 domain-containing protein [Actinomadura sp. DC4]|uniref:DUF4386 domain-containing protein n=1 Tax=Actinomadura sp. DC4 TaxID=3055069 RepID=UPI0025AF29C0|nr:DUF4386 domain-containing protein [Actinomadura sp. DC4]MDN3355616.1 DUF4386 domain-containing protein [Actinomadura sp. DC4]
MDVISGTSPQRLARIAGALYLVNIVAGAFAIGLVPAMLIKPGIATTVQNIQTHELLYRLGLVAHILVTITNIPMAVIFYDLFKVVNRRLALLDVFFTLVATSAEVAGLLNQFTPVVLLGNGHYANTLSTAQLQALAYLPSDLSTIDYSIYGVFFGLDIMCVAYLLLRSTFMPSTIGVLLAVDALAYLVYGVADLLSPGFTAHLVPWAQLPTILGEGSLCLWLLIAGVDVDRWKSTPCRTSGWIGRLTNGH